MKIILLVAILFIGCVSGSKVAESPSVAVGDTVSLNYVAKIDGLVLDTSYESIAKDAKVPKAWMFRLRPSYEPLSLVVGSGLIVPVEEALIGMKVGEEKTVVIPPEKGYGERNESLVRSMSRFVIIPREIDISLQHFRLSYNKEPVLNDTVEDIYWNSSIIKVTNETVLIRHEPSPAVKEAPAGELKIFSVKVEEIEEAKP